MRGFARVSVAVPTCVPGATRKNAEETVKLWRKAHEERSALVVFPELGLSTYTARDMFLDRTLLDSSLGALERVVEESRALEPLGIVGMPLEHGAGVYNVAVVIQRGKILGVVPKSFLPNYREFEERRWFRPGTEVPKDSTTTLCGQTVPFGTDLLFQAEPLRSLVVGVEICEDIWVQAPPSSRQVGAGATVCVNLSASNFTIGKADLRRLLCTSASDRGKCAYLYVAAGPGESSTDLAFDADAFVCENGTVLAESKRFARESQIVTVDVDLEELLHERRATVTFGDCAAELGAVFRRVPFHADHAKGIRRDINPHPFLPRDPKTLSTRLWEIFEIQTNALATRMAAMTTATWAPKLVLGVSGGLDSTQAALVAATALDLLGRSRKDLVCVTMPGLGTSDTTKSNAVTLSEALGAELRTISIADGARMVLDAVGHPAAKGAASVEEMIERIRADKRLGDPTLENVQARMRTLILMTIANQVGGIVVGTGDLSEKALGWSTYNGDHLSMYDVNAGVPKTLIQFVIRWVANERVTTWVSDGHGDPQKLREVLFGILDTPISPELLPPDPDGKIAHLTEAAIGPYELHDFYLFHFVRHGATPSRILDMARHAFGERYSVDEHKKWLKMFLQRFFTNQFKRSATADGPKVGTVALSPRGDWRMPSDMSPAEWTAQVDAYKPEG